eukprot:2685710-Pyramimonas_sp.AAC.1
MLRSRWWPIVRLLRACVLSGVDASSRHLVAAAVSTSCGGCLASVASAPSAVSRAPACPTALTS